MNMAREERRNIAVGPHGKDSRIERGRHTPSSFLRARKVNRPGVGPNVQSDMHSLPIHRFPADAGVDMHAGDRLGKMLISGEHRALEHQHAIIA